MKKILSLLASMSLTATATVGVVSCSNDIKNTPENSDNEPANNQQKISFDNVYSNWNKYNDSYIKNFMSQNFPIAVSSDQLSYIKQNSNSPEKINDANITEKIISAFIPKIFVWGLTDSINALSTNGLSFVFNNLHEKNGSSDYDAPNKALCWSGILTSSKSDKQFKLSGWFVENTNDYSTFSEINNTNEKQIFNELNSYDKNGNNINAPGYFLSLDFSGKKDNTNFLIPDQKYTINLNEANSKLIAYLTSYLKALGIVDVNYSPNLTDYNFSFLETEGTKVDETIQVSSSSLNGAHSWVHPGTISWGNDSSSHIQLVGSILIKGYQY